MKLNKQRPCTRLVEMVETHNLALAFNRLDDSFPYDSMRKRRALYHALLMSKACFNATEIAAIRVALELP